MRYYYWRFAVPSRERLTWEVAQLLPKGTMLEAAVDFPFEYKIGDFRELVGCYVSEYGIEYVKIITENNPFGGGFHPDQFYMPEIKNGSELFHKIKIAEHQKALDKLNKNEYAEKYQKLWEQFAETIRNLKKEYGIEDNNILD